MAWGTKRSATRWGSDCVLLLGLLLLGAGCERIGEFEWSGAGDMGAVKSAEWIRFTTTDNSTFSGELTLNFFVLSNVPDLCGAYQTAVADAFDMHTRFLNDRAPYLAADDLNNAELCRLTQTYYENLGAATAELAKPGRAYVSTSFGYSNIGSLGEEGQPQEGTFTMTPDIRAEDGDFFRAFVRLFDANPYTLLAETMDCADANWASTTGLGAYTEYRGEPTEDLAGTMDSQLFGDTEVHLTQHDVMAVTGDRTRAGVLNTEGQYLLCELRAHNFFLRVFER